MTWMIIGGSRYANFACNTGMEAFGPLHENYTDGESAKEELKEFAVILDEDPRVLDRQDNLRPQYVNWKKSQR